MTRIRIQVLCDVTLTPRQVWPDDDVPEVITEEAVREAIDDTSRSPGDLIEEWNLPADVKVTVLP